MATTATLITNNVQVGQNATATNNFTLRNPELGLLYLSVGNANSTTTDILSVNSSNQTLTLNSSMYTFGLTPVSGPAGSGLYSAEYIFYNGAGGSNASVAFKTARGTAGSPVTTINGDVIGNTDYWGFNSAAFQYAGSIDCVANANWTPTSTPTQFNFNLAAPNSITPDAVANIQNIGTSALPNGQLTTGTIITQGLNTSQYSLSMYAWGVSADTNTPGLSISSARGTQAVPTAIQAGDTLGDMDFFGYSGTGTTYVMGGGLDFVAASNFSTSNAQTNLLIALAPVNSIAPVTVMTLFNTGDLQNTGSYFNTGTSTTTTIPAAVNATLGAVTSGYSTMHLSATGVTTTPNASTAFITSRGTLATPTATQSGDTLGNFDFFGYGTAWAYSASFDVVASGVFSGTSTPTQFNINLTPVNATTPALTFQLMSTGYINIGSVTNLGGIAFGTTTPKVLISGTAPTVSSGFGTGSSITANGTLTFRLNVGTGGAATSGVIGLPTAATGWNATIQVFAPTATNLLQTTAVTASTVSSITLTNYTTSTGAAVAWPASTVLVITCVAY